MKISRERSLLAALIFTLLAVGIHFYLARQHYGLKYGGASGASVCNVSSTFNCDAVAASDFSSFLGIPIAVFGAVANLMLFFFLAITRLQWTDDSRSSGRYALWLASLIALTSVVMAGISLTQMSTYCLFCWACYVLSFLGFFFTWKGTDGFQSVAGDFKALFTTHRWVLVCALLIPGLSFLVHKSLLNSSGAADVERSLGDFVRQWQAMPEQTFNLSTGLVLHKGSGEPKMTIVEFADFRCSHCKHAAPTLHAFAEARPDVKLIMKFFPLDGCNPQFQNQSGGDGISCHIAYLVHCAEKLSKSGWAAHNYFFKLQDKIIGMRSPQEITKMYCDENAGDCQALTACSEEQSTKDEVRAMAQEGVDAQVQGTPAIFGNGRLIRGGQMLPVLDAVYDGIPTSR